MSQLLSSTSLARIFFLRMRTLKIYLLAISNIAKYSIVNNSHHLYNMSPELIYHLMEVCTFWPPLLNFPTLKSQKQFFNESNFLTTKHKPVSTPYFLTVFSPASLFLSPSFNWAFLLSSLHFQDCFCQGSGQKVKTKITSPFSFSSPQFIKLQTDDLFVVII